MPKMETFLEGLKELEHHYSLKYDNLEIGVASSGKITCTVDFPRWSSTDHERIPGDEPNWYERSCMRKHGWIWNQRMKRFELDIRK